MRNYIILNGVNSQTISGLLIQNLPPISKPQKRSQIEEIDGRNGDIVTTLGYGAYDKTFEIGLYGDFDINEIISYFDSEGIVIFSNEPDKYYNYQILDQIDFEKLIRYRTATVKMHVQPFKYSTTEEQITDDTEVIEGQGTSITLENSADDTFTAFDLKGNTYQSMVSGETGTNVTGTNLELDDVNSTKENYINLLGDTSQVQARGVNLLGFKDYSTTINGVTFTFSTDGTLTINGTATSLISTSPGLTSAYNSYKFDADTDYTFTKYYVSGSASNISYGSFSLKTSRALDFTLGHVYFFTNDYNTTYTETNTTPSVSDTIYYFNIYISGGSVFNNLVFKFQLEKGSTATEYEEYNGGIAIPSPTNPSEITTVTGENNIVVSNKNLFNKDNANVLNAYVDSTSVNSNKNCRLLYIPCLSNTTYTISKIISARFRVATTSEIPANGVTSYNYTSNDNGTSITITTGENSKYLCVFFYQTQYDTTYTYEQVINSIQIEKSSTATSYVAHQGGTYPISLGKINYIPTSLATMQTNNTAGTWNGNVYSRFGLTFTVNDDLSVVVNGTSTSSGTFLICNNEVLKAGTYVLNGINATNNEASLYIWDSSWNNVYSTTSSGTFTINEDKTIKVGINITSGKTFNNFVVKPMISKEGGSYTPSGGQIELCKIGNYQDYIYYKYGNWYKHSEIGKVVLNGSESWNKDGSRGFYTQKNDMKRLTDYTDLVLSDNFKSGYNYNSLSNYQISGYSSATSYLGQNWIYIKDDDFSVANDFKTWISTHNTTVYYVLATPTDTQITDTTLISQLNALYTADIYNGKTHITSDGPIINMDYNVVSVVPSPTNPSPIKVVTGDNTITISNGDATATQTLPVELDDLELCNYNNYREYLYKQNDNWYKMGYIGKLEVNTSNITLISTYTNVAYASIPKPSNASCYGVTTDISVLCNKASYSSGLASYDSKNAIGYIFTQADANNFYIGFSKNTTLAEMQSLLANTVIYYNLSLEASTQITDTTLIGQLNNVISANTYDGETIITSTYETGNEPLYLYVSAYDKLDLTITNSGNTNARPVFTVYGVGTIGIYLNGNQLFSIALGDEEYITIDTENLEAYQDTTSNLKNRLVTGDYDNFYLPPGENNITFEGKVNEFQISNYSRWI